MRRLIVSCALLAAPAALHAQLPDPSARALGMGGAYTVLARGYEATAWNPGLLAAHGRPGLSIGLAQAQMDFGSNAYNFSDFVNYNEKQLTDADKQYLLRQITDSTLTVRAFAGVTPFAIQIGRFAVSLSTSADINGGLSRDAVDLALFGNATRSGPGQFFTGAGSSGGGWAATTLAGSYAMPFQLPMGRLSAGVTLKKVWGNALAQGREITSHFQVDPAFDAQASGHVIYTTYPDNYNVGAGSLFGSDGSPGNGFGLDLGGVLELGRITVGATIVNLVGSMSWDADRLRYLRSDIVVAQNGNGDVGDTSHDSVLVGAAISSDLTARALRDTLLAHASFSRLVRAGASLRFGGLRLAADAQLRLSEGLDRVPSQSVSVGAEYVVLGILPLRAGLGTDFSDALTLSAGSGLWLGPVHLDIGASTTSGTTRNGVRLGAGLGVVF